MLTKTCQLLVVVLSLSLCKTHAQVTTAAAGPVTLPFTHDVDSVFQNLNKSYITTGVLYDRIYPFAALHMFNTAAADTSSANHFLQLITRFSIRHTTMPALPFPDTVDAWIAKIQATGVQFV